MSTPPENPGPPPGGEWSEPGHGTTDGATDSGAGGYPPAGSVPPEDSPHGPGHWPAGSPSGHGAGGYPPAGSSPPEDGGHGQGGWPAAGDPGANGPDGHGYEAYGYGAPPPGSTWTGGDPSGSWGYPGTSGGYPGASWGAGSLAPSEERGWAVCAHLSGLVIGFVGPLLIFLLCKDRSAFVRRHAAQALNLQIFLAVYTVAAIIVTIGTIGFGLLVVIPLTLLLGLGVLISVIMGAAAASAGRDFVYPLTLQVVR